MMLFQSCAVFMSVLCGYLLGVVDDQSLHRRLAFFKSEAKFLNRREDGDLAVWVDCGAGGRLGKTRLDSVHVSVMRNIQTDMIRAAESRHVNHRKLHIRNQGARELRHR